MDLGTGLRGGGPWEKTGRQVMYTDQVSARPLAAWPKSALRIAFGVVWAIDATLKWLPGFKDGYKATIGGIAMGQPDGLRWWFDFWIRVQQDNATFFWGLIAVVETLIALALIFGFARKATYLAAAVFSLMVWMIPEGFGGPYASGASDIGTSIIYVAVFAGLLTLAYYTGADRYSVDYLIERRLGWWWRLAEVRRPVPVPAATPSARRLGIPVSSGQARAPIRDPRTTTGRHARSR
jgi:nitrite reductase (NO-forming)